MAIRESVPTTLTTWRLSNDKSFRNAQVANIGTVFAGADAPKTKFLFTVSFKVRNTNLGINPGSDNMSLIEYACKTVSRPNININYVDLNSYNYRFKVATRTDFGTVTLSLYDDNKNLANALLLNYLNEVSPVTNMSREQFKIRSEDMQNFSSIGPLEHRDGVIESMRVTHHYSSDYKDGIGGHSFIAYDYINPKIQTFQWDDLDMGASEPPMITATFVYDSVNVVTEHIEQIKTGGQVIVNGGDTDDGDVVENIRNNGI